MSASRGKAKHDFPLRIYMARVGETRLDFFVSKALAEKTWSGMEIGIFELVQVVKLKK